MGKVVHFRRDTRIYNLAQRYFELYTTRGWQAAGTFLNAYVPEQLYHQIQGLCEDWLEKGDYSSLTDQEDED